MYTAPIWLGCLIDLLQIFDESWELVASPVSLANQPPVTRAK